MKRRFLKEFFRTVILAALSLLLSQFAFAQTTSPMSDNDIDIFLETLSSRALSVNTISAGFRQEKKMDMLKNNMLSEGRFYYMKENKIAFMYEKPGKYSMIMNGQYLKMNTGYGSSKMDLSSNPVMKQMNDLLTAVFTGSLDRATASYDISFTYLGEEVVASVKPRSSRISAVISLIKIQFEKGSGDINEIIVTEGSGSTTKYIFFDRRINQQIANEIFTIN